VEEIYEIYVTAIEVQNWHTNVVSTILLRRLSEDVPLDTSFHQLSAFLGINSYLTSSGEHEW
jgi:hypothetical protein